MELINKLFGNSGAEIALYKDKDKFFVKKSKLKSISKTIQIYSHLKSQGFYVPEIYEHNNEYIIMEYINGLDIKNFILHYGKEAIFLLEEFLIHYFKNIKLNNEFNFNNEIEKKFDSLSKDIEKDKLKFSLNSLRKKIPTIHSKELSHGDLTFDNIIFKNKKLYLIDPNPTKLSSVNFDVCKILQDIDCYWFIRFEKQNLDLKILCNELSNRIKKKIDIMNNKFILIFMLLRIIPYCKDAFSKEYLFKSINNLWMNDSN